MKHAELADINKLTKTEQQVRHVPHPCEPVKPG